MTATTPVIINVYDLADFNAYLNWAGLGAYHTGVQCHGREYAFGGALNHAKMGRRYNTAAIFVLLRQGSGDSKDDC